MSGSLPAGRRLQWRVGAYPSARRPREPVGSVVTVIFELRDTQAGALVPAPGLSAIAWRPRLGGFAEQAVPLSPVLLQPGQWQVDFETEMTGTYSVQAVSLGPSAETITATIDSV